MNGLHISNTVGRAYNKILVIGLGRSGTSSIGSLLYHLGYFIGESDGEHQNPFYESPRLRDQFLKEEANVCATALTGLASQHPRYAWKDPKLASPKGLDVLSLLDNGWLVISVFRDPVAIAQRRVASDGISFADALKLVTKGQARLLDFCARCAKPAIYISYEYFITQTAAVVSELVKHIDHDPTTASAELTSIDRDVNSATGIDALVSAVLRDRENYRAHATKPNAPADASGARPMPPDR